MLVCTLTGRAAICYGISLQALTLDGLSAADAYAIRTQRNAPQRMLDSANLLDIARHLGQIDIHQEVSEGLILQIAHTAGDLGVGLVFGARERFARLVAQLAPPVPQLVLEMRIFTAARALGSSGVVCLRCHGNAMFSNPNARRPQAPFARRAGSAQSRGLAICYEQWIGYVPGPGGR